MDKSYKAKLFQLSAVRGMVVCLAIIALAFSACQRRDELIAGVDIPIPAKMTKNADAPSEQIPGLTDGQVSYQGKVTAPEIFTFYQEVMAAKGWQPTAVFADKKDRIAYTKENKLVLIRYNEVGDGTTILTIFVGPKDLPKQ